MKDVYSEGEPEGDINETVDRLVQVAIRRRRWIVLVASGVALAAFGVVQYLPNRYISEATLVLQQQVSEAYVSPTGAAGLVEDLQARTQQLLSRSRLLAIADEFGLYADQRGLLSSEELSERIRQRITIDPLESRGPRRDVLGFRVAFVAETPELAERITGRLAGVFVEESARARTRRATVTANFLHEQVENARSKVEALEERLRRVKTTYQGQLPEQQLANAQMLANLHLQLQSLTADLNRVRAQRVQLKSSAEGHLNKMRSQKAALLERYTAQHPTVLKLSQSIALLENTVKGSEQTARAGAGNQGGRVEVVVPVANDEASDLDELRAQWESNRLEAENLRSEQDRLRKTVAEYQARVNAAPVRQQEIEGVLREYELSKQEYAELLGKESQSQLVANMEQQQQGDVFRIVDPPSRPQKPFSPKRLKLTVGGTVAGIGLGLALAFLVDIRDRSFHSEKQLSQQFALPLVVGVPLLLTPGENRVHTVKQILEWVAASVLGLAVMAAEFYVYRHG